MTLEIRRAAINRLRRVERERDVKAKIVQLLRARGFVVEVRTVSGATAMPGGKWVQRGTRGQADLYGWHIGTGRHFEIEVKAPGKKPRRDQMVWLSTARNTGAIAFWADSVEAADRALLTFGL
jgi:hypothetical protein